jgi:iron-sulfur cluster assembly accessory protein
LREITCSGPLGPYSHINDIEDTVFEADLYCQVKVVMDLESLELVSGSTVDYTTELIGSQFKIVDNPGAMSNCGCGTSFDIKI